MFWPFSSIYQPGLPWNKRDPPTNSPFGVRSLDMSDVLTIDRESLGKSNIVQQKHRIYDHLWRRIGPRLQKARWNEFSAFTLPGKGRMSKTNPNKLEQHLFVIDQASNIARSNTVTIFAQLVQSSFFVSRSRRLLQRRLQLCFYYPQRRWWWIHIFMWTARTRRKIFWSSLPLILFMITNIHRSTGTQMGTHECFTYTAYADVFRIAASFWTVYCLRLVRWERCKDMRRKGAKSHSTGQHTHPPANSSNIFSNRNIRILLWLDPIVAYSTYHLTIPWSVHHKMAKDQGSMAPSCRSNSSLYSLALAIPAAQVWTPLPNTRREKRYVQCYWCYCLSVSC